MKKTIGIIIAIIVILLLIFFFMRGKNNQSDQVASNSSTTETKNGESMEQSSLKYLFAANKSQKCTYSTTEQNTTNKGTVYVSSGKMRGDFTVTAADGKVQGSHMITQDNTSYIWMDGMSTGYKMKFDDAAQANGQASQGVDPNKNFNFKCENWSADSSMFSLPSTVQFQDMSAMMQSNGAAGGSAGAGANMDHTALCAGLEEPAKTQ